MQSRLTEIRSLHNRRLSLSLVVFLCSFSSDIVKILSLCLVALTSNQYVVTLISTNIVPALVPSDATTTNIFVVGCVVIELISVKVLICRNLSL